jgi:hypothetical protein
MPRLLGNRIYLEIPKKEESKLIVDENTKEALEKEMIKKMSRLTVHSIGELVTNVKVGEEVLVDPEALSRAKVIPYSEKEDVLLISPFDVIHVW